MKRICISVYRVFLRSIQLCIPYLALLASTIFIIARIYTLDTTKSPIQSFTSSLKIGIIGFIAFAFFSYELNALPERSGAEESTISNGGRVKWTKASLIALVSFLLIWALLIFLTNTGFYVFNTEEIFGPYLFHMFLAVILYCFLPGLAAVGLGCALSGWKRVPVLLVILFVSFLVSSLPMKYFINLSETISAAGFLDWFYLTVPNTDYITDAVYGIPLEPCRFARALFWLSLFAILILIRLKRIRFRLLWILISVSVGIACGVFFAARGTQDVMYKDDRPDSVISGESEFRRNHAEEHFSGYSAVPVTAYNLDLKLGIRLSARAEMALEENDTDRYVFTLYHGYEVREVLGEGGAPLDFHQEGDHIYVSARHPERSISLRYQGKCSKYYANCQAACLPGYFAWYPVPGEEMLWDSRRSAWKPIMEQSPTRFTVTVHAGYSVVSNLPETGRNRFEGNSAGASLYGGLVKLEAEGKDRVIGSPVGGPVFTGSVSGIASMLERARDLSGMDNLPEVRGGMVILQPWTIAMENGHEIPVVATEGQLFFCNLSSKDSSIVSQIISDRILDRTETGLLKEAFCGLVSDPESGSSVRRPDREELEILIRYKDLSEIDFYDNETIVQYMNAEETYKELFIYELGQAEDPSGFFHEVYEYLMAPEVKVNQVDFLYSMEGD